MNMIRAPLLWISACFLAGVVAGVWSPSPGRREEGSPPTPRASGSGPVKTVSGTGAKPSALRPAGAAGEAWDFLDKLSDATAEDMPELWAALPPNDNWRRGLLVERWAELDPRAAFAFVNGLGGEQAQLLENVFRSWARADADAALAALRNVSGLEAQGLAVRGLIASAMEEPARAVSLLRQLSWMDVGKLEEDQFLTIFPDDLLRRLHAADAEGLKSLTAWMPSWFAGRLEALEWRRLLASDPAVAEDFLKSMKWDAALPNRLAPALEELARENPHAAADWLDRLGEKAGGGKEWLARAGTPPRDSCTRY